MPSDHSFQVASAIGAALIPLIFPIVAECTVMALRDNEYRDEVTGYSVAGSMGKPMTSPSEGGPRLSSLRGQPGGECPV